MTKQFKPSVTNPTIATIYKEIESGNLILRPDFQRKFVWTHEHQEQFIDTILKGLPFPEIYVCEGEVDLKLLKTTRYVIDGQQRLTTIKRYIDGKYDKPLSTVPRYDDLSDERKTDFLSYQIVVRDIGTVDETTVREIFRRINLTKFKLEDVEIHNAVYDGCFIKSAKEILENTMLEQYGVFKESEFTRMADLHFILLVMATLENGGYFAQDREVESNISEFNDEYPNKDIMIEYLIRTFNVINELDLPLDSIWFRKSNFFTLVVELVRHIEELPHDLKLRLLALEDDIIKNKKDPASEFGQYYSYMYQATHGRKARVVRANLFNKYIFK